MVDLVIFQITGILCQRNCNCVHSALLMILYFGASGMKYKMIAGSQAIAGLIL